MDIIFFYTVGNDFHNYRGGQHSGLGGISSNVGKNGLQLLGKPFGEMDLLRAAHAYEQATEWHKAKPGL